MNSVRRFLVCKLGGVMIILGAGSVQASNLNIEVTGIDPDRGGHIMVMIFSEQGFPKAHQEALFIENQSQLRPVMNFSFKLNQGDVAVKVLHDEDGDGKVSKNWTGIYPKEGLGFSNHQRVTLLGAPVYPASKVSREVFQNGLSIEMSYP